MMTIITSFLEIRFPSLYLLIFQVPGLSLLKVQSNVRDCVYGCLQVKISVVDFLLLSSL